MIALAARGLMRRARSASLGTALLNQDGWAYVSLVTVACDCDGSPILLLSDLADHTRNLAQDSRGSLLFEAASGKTNPQTGPRVTVLGRMEKTSTYRHRRRFLARHPSANLYAGFGDFFIYRMAVERAHYVAGFGRAHWIEGDDIIFDGSAADAIANREPEILERLNGKHAKDVSLLANSLLERRGDDWSMVAIDPDGCDLKRRGTIARLDFPRTVASADALEDMLSELTEKARRRGA